MIKSEKPAQRYVCDKYRELEKIRFEIQQQVEADHSAKQDILEKECEKFRDLYYKLRRELESSRAESEQKVFAIFIV